MMRKQVTSRLQFLLNPIGSAGDVHPFLAVGQRLLERDHDVVVLTNPVFEESVRKTGLQFVPIGTRNEMRKVGTNPEIHEQMHAWKLALQWGAIGTMRETFEAIQRLSRNRPTVVVTSALGFGARIANENLGLPMATILIDPDKLRSVVQSPVIPPLQLQNWMPRFVKRVQLWAADRFVIDPVIASETNDFRRELGLPPVKRLLHRWWLSPQLIIGLFHPWFAPPQPDWPPNVELVGPTLWDPGCNETEYRDVENFLASGEPPIVLVPGSAGTASSRFLEVGTESCLQLKQRGIILTRRRIELPSGLPPNVRHFNYVPLGMILPRCSALVHHGGTGTAAQALAAGIPQLICPMAFNHADIAARLERLGVACTISKRKFTERNVVSALKKLGQSRLKENCQRVAQWMEGQDPLSNICILLERLQGTPSD